MKLREKITIKMSMTILVLVNLLLFLWLLSSYIDFIGMIFYLNRQMSVMVRSDIAVVIYLILFLIFLWIITRGK